MYRKHAVLNFENLYQNAACGLITFRLDGSVLFANKTLLRWLEIEEKEFFSRNFTEFLNKDGMFYYELFVLPRLRLHNEVREINLDVKTPSGNFPCLFSAYSGLSGDSEEKDTMIQGAFFKVVDRKKYENELLKERMEAEEQKREKADILKEIGFAQSHLVRAPVANILGLLSLLDTASLDEDIRKIVLLLRSSAEKLDQEVKNVVNKTYQQSLK